MLLISFFTSVVIIIYLIFSKDYVYSNVLIDFFYFFSKTVKLKFHTFSWRCFSSGTTFLFKFTFYFGYCDVESNVKSFFNARA